MLSCKRNPLSTTKHSPSATQKQTEIVSKHIAALAYLVDVIITYLRSFAPLVSCNNGIHKDIVLPIFVVVEADQTTKPTDTGYHTYSQVQPNLARNLNLNKLGTTTETSCYELSASTCQRSSSERTLRNRTSI